MAFFLITIDTEGDNAWSRPRLVTTKNASQLNKFQVLCEKYGFAPTYFVNHEMAIDPVFQEFARDTVRRGKAEIGMHMHAWDSPPIEPLTDRDWYYQPYSYEYPADLVWRKAEYMTRLLEDTFNLDIRSHRAGRWGLNPQYAQCLAKLGYTVDCSVSSLVSWRSHAGLPNGEGGPDFTDFPTSAYWLDLDTLREATSSPILEIPTTIMNIRRPVWRTAARALLGRKGPRTTWLRPNGRNLQDMLKLLDQKVKSGADYIQFTLHSSEFMPGGSPTFPTEQSIAALFRDMDTLFHAISRHYNGSTVLDYSLAWQQGKNRTGIF